IYKATDTKSINEYMGPSPSVFIGSFGYPKVIGGPLMTADSDNPLNWIQRGLSIGDIVNIRSNTIRGEKKIGVLNINTESIGDIALSSSPIDIEVEFTKPVKYNLNSDDVIVPIGRSGPMKKMTVIDNAHVSNIVDRCVSDTDLHAVEAANILFENGTDIYKIINLLSSGLLGVKRKMVPTRWAITATDNMISNKLKHDIFRMPAIPEYRVFSSTLHGQSHCFILIPAADWRFEMIERSQKNTIWAKYNDWIMADQEQGLTKSQYSPIGGSYYSARLAVLKYLKSIGYCANVICIHDISPECWAPLGTWVIREASHASFSNPPQLVGTISEAISIANQYIKDNFWVLYSSILKDLKYQKRLFDFY
ncbi:MAG TPA: hypothetical protein O0X99_02685, partial [Methanocorpusculum sp.]|nr:hypothetical protein [Methanocorpusculum sp.]